MRLVYSDTGRDVQEGDVVGDEGEWIVTGWREPHKPSSTGRVFVVSDDGFNRQFFPSVFDMEFRPFMFSVKNPSGDREIVLEHLRSARNGTTVRLAMRATGLSESKVRKVLRDLRREGLVKYTGAHGTFDPSWRLLPEMMKNPTAGMTAKGKRMERHIAESGSARAPSAVVYARAKEKEGTGLVKKKWAKEHGYPRPNGGRYQVVAENSEGILDDAGSSDDLKEAKRILGSRAGYIFNRETWRLVHHQGLSPERVRQTERSLKRLSRPYTPSASTGYRYPGYESFYPEENPRPNDSVRLKKWKQPDRIVEGASYRGREWYGPGGEPLETDGWYVQEITEIERNPSVLVEPPSTSYIEESVNDSAVKQFLKSKMGLSARAALKAAHGMVDIETGPSGYAKDYGSVELLEFIASESSKDFSIDESVFGGGIYLRDKTIPYPQARYVDTVIFDHHSGKFFLTDVNKWENQ